MRNIMLKEIKLSSSPLAFIFIAFGAMFMLPGYPVLCGAFFVTLGLFQSFQTAREANDIVFSALLPIAKKDVVKGRFMFVCFIELCALILMLVCVIIRMTALKDSVPYVQNALMNANLFALSGALVIYGLFNLIFVCQFYKTAYKIGKPFVTYIIVNFVVIGIFEALHHVPGLQALNAFGTDNMGLQFILLVAGAAFYAIITALAYKKACNYFENIDL
ncbi:MAG: ABC-2 transporter permease [Firmicutes bacterium]|nr:ABC-2 transporter permease [Bacillota bacterium]